MLHNTTSNKLSLEEFQEINEIALDIIFAETGADRELDFNYESEVEKLYNSDLYSNQLYRTKLDKGE